MRFPALVAATFWASGSACQCGDELAEVPGRIDGQVCDPENGAPLKNIAVRLQLSGRIVGTDGDGRYTFTNVAPGDDVVEVGVGAARRTFAVVVDSSVSVSVVDVACRPLPAGFGAITGELCGLDLNPLVDALVQVSIENDDGTLTLSQSRSDGNGAFSLEHVAAGDHILEIRSPTSTRDIAVTVFTAQTTLIPASLTCSNDVVSPPVGPNEPTTTPPEDPPPPPPVPPTPAPVVDEPIAPPCTPTTEICENGSDEDCDGTDNACDPITLDLFIDGDCVTASCPPQAPHPVGCDIRLQGGDGRGCVANTRGSPVVYFQEGDVCSAGRVTGTLLCSSFLPPDPLNATNCPINKNQQIHAENRDGCPDTD